jgi:D-psicose/D-tagatose/L-ribulose 3-epimerase
MDNKLAVNLMVWSGNVGRNELQLLPAIAEMGYDGVELPIFDVKSLDAHAIRQAVAASGLACTVSTALPTGLNLIDEDAAGAGVDFLLSIVEMAALLGAPVVCGPMAVEVGELRGRGYTAAEWDRCVHSLQRVSTRAHEAGVRLAFELLNRFETFFLNTVDDGVRLAEAVANPAFGLLLDTFHMHIEEKSMADAIRLAGRHLVHFHASENDRGVCGTGQVAWTDTFDALADVGYEGWVVVESFNAVIPELAGATCVWRPLAESPETLARESLEFLRRHL